MENAFIIVGDTQEPMLYFKIFLVALKQEKKTEVKKLRN